MIQCVISVQIIFAQKKLFVSATADTKTSAVATDVLVDLFLVFFLLVHKETIKIILSISSVCM